MDPRDIKPPQEFQQLQPPQPGMLMNHFNNPNAAASLLLPPNRLPFGVLAPHHPQPQQMDQKTLESLGFGDGSSPSSQPIRFGIEQSPNHQNQLQQQVNKKKRGRPRKYTPDGNIALGLAPTSPMNSYGEGGVGDTEPPAKRNRGRPPGSTKKLLDSLGGSVGIGFIPHVIEVNIGEDIASKVMAFSEQGPRTVCVLSASGAVSRVILRQATNPTETLNVEGRFDIITLSGSFMNYEVNGSIQRSGKLSVALAGSNGQILGGVVVSSLIAATQVQVIVGSFVAEAKKPSVNNALSPRLQNPEPVSAPPANNMLNFGSNSQGPSSESSGENESASPSLQRDNNNSNNGMYGNLSVAQQQQQQQHQQRLQQQHHMQMLHHWTGQGQ